jgi:hypothetical protein
MAGVNTKHANRLGGESLRLDSAATCRYVLGTSCWKFLLKWLIRLEDQVVARDGNQNKYTPYANLSFRLSKTLSESVSVSS